MEPCYQKMPDGIPEITVNKGTFPLPESCMRHLVDRFPEIKEDLDRFPNRVTIRVFGSLIVETHFRFPDR